MDMIPIILNHLLIFILISCTHSTFCSVHSRNPLVQTQFCSSQHAQRQITTKMSSHAKQVHEQAMFYARPIIGILNGIGTNSRGTQSHKSKPTDIMLNTYPKSGTVLAQQICYQIAALSGGAPSDDPTGMEYDDIATAVPWIENMRALHMPDSKTTPRIYKTHKMVSVYPENSSKHIVVARDPTKISASFLNFMFSNVHEDTDIESVPEDIKEECVNIVNQRVLLSGATPLVDIGPWHHFLKDGAHPKKNNVLVIFYEDMVKQLRSTIIRISKFMNCQLSNDHVDLIIQRCDREYMATDPKFDGHFEQKSMGFKYKPRHTVPKDFKGFKQSAMSNEQQTQFEQMNLKAFGVKTYDEIRQKVNEEQLELHGF